MFRLTTLAMLLALAFGAAVMTGCDSGSKGSQANSPKAAPPSGSEATIPPVSAPKP